MKVSAKRTAYPIAFPVGEGEGADEIAAIQTFDLSLTGEFRVIEPAEYKADLKAEGMGIEPQKWKDSGAFGVVKFTATASDIEFRFYKVSEGTKPALTMKMKRGDLRAATHRWCNAVYKSLTGEDGFFGSKIAFNTRGKSARVHAMDFDGKNPFSPPANGPSMLPAFSPRGVLAYTAFTRNNADLFVATGSQPRKLSSQVGMNTGAVFSPDGSKIALTLSKDGNAEIYVISATDGAIIKRITEHPGIDTSPAWSPDGAQLAFVSDRNGSPQIFVVSSDGGTPTQVSSSGNYNTSPTWSPRKGKQIIAYTMQDKGANDIVMLDLQTKQLTHVTQGEGSNDSPAFSPNGRMIAFARAGKGVFIAPIDGSVDPVNVWSGAATGVRWGPAPSVPTVTASKR